MRLFAQLLNIALILSVIYELFDHGFPEPHPFVFLVYLLPIVNLYALNKMGGNSDNVISLYLKRKKLEEQAKIDALKRG